MKTPTKTLLALIVLTSGCAVQPVGSRLRVVDMYPDEVYATLEAWTKMKGEPRNVQTVLDAEVQYGVEADVQAMCGLSIGLDGCTNLEADGHVRIMFQRGFQSVFIVEHEVSHAIAAVNGELHGDPHHTDPVIWGPQGIVKVAAGSLGHVVTVDPPQSNVP